MSAAREIEDRAARWLIRREEADWSPDEQLELDVWLNESMAHKAAYWRLEHGWREADRIRSLGGPTPTQFETGSRQPRRWLPFAVAASLVAAVGTGTLVLDRHSPAPISIAKVMFHTPVGGRRTVPFSDGSTVELNTATVLRAAVTPERREIWLDKGEAYFEIAHIEGQPFVVHAGNRTVTVLGTKFSVRRDGDKVTVSVVEGRVRVEDTRTQEATPAIITAGDVAIARGRSTLLLARSEERVDNALAWRSGVLTFDQSTLSDVAAEFNRYNRRPIIITDPEAANIRIGGTFQAANVDAFVRLLRDAYGLKVETDANAIKISS